MDVRAVVSGQEQDPVRPSLKLLCAEIGGVLTPKPLLSERFTAALPRGDGHPVLVLPPFLRGDGGTRVLRQMLLRLGYDAHPWRLGVNIGPTEAVLDGLEERLLSLALASNRRITLIGHSLGGVFARALAVRYPDQVRRVITLCSPFTLPTASTVMPIYRMAARYHSRDAEQLEATLSQPLPMPATAIYTKRDGIVCWTSCIDRVSPFAENIEVKGAHGTMAQNRKALRIIAGKLALPDRSQPIWNLVGYH